MKNQIASTITSVILTIFGIVTICEPKETAPIQSYIIGGCFLLVGLLGLIITITITSRLGEKLEKKQEG